MATMLHRTGLIAYLLLAVLIAGAASAGPKIQLVESPGGVKAWLVSDDTVPVISLRFSMRGGAECGARGGGREGRPHSQISSPLTSPGASSRLRTRAAALAPSRRR